MVVVGGENAAEQRINSVAERDDDDRESERASVRERERGEVGSSGSGAPYIGQGEERKGRRQGGGGAWWPAIKAIMAAAIYGEGRRKGPVWRLITEP